MPRGPGVPGGPSMPGWPLLPSGPRLPGSPGLPTLTENKVPDQRNVTKLQPLHYSGLTPQENTEVPVYNNLFELTSPLGPDSPASPYDSSYKTQRMETGTIVLW